MEGLTIDGCGPSSRPELITDWERFLCDSRDNNGACRIVNQPVPITVVRALDRLDGCMLSRVHYIYI